MRLYIAGPMSGLPEMNYPAFIVAEHALSEAGYEIENPVNNENPDPEDYLEWLRLGIKQLIRCEGVAFLPGFGMSKGAMMELYIANVLKMQIRSVDEWLIEAYRQKHPVGEDEGPESNPSCAHCGHNRGLHETKVADIPYGYCVHVECDCVRFVE